MQLETGIVLGVLVLAPFASAAASDVVPALFSTRPLRDRSAMVWPSCGDDGGSEVRAGALAVTSVHFERTGETQPLHAAAIEHSDAYLMRAKIHKYASFATLPLFAAEVALGQSLYDTPANAGSKRAAHAIVGSGIVGLFGVNTVTGAWNLFGEGRQDPEGRTLRLVHGLLMMAADVGFLATTASGPNSGSRRGALTFETDKVTHRNIAIASISVGTAGYLLMLFGNH
ncbi:MAG TPA: hypothetical protein VHU82_07005 [Vicinamibacterales bacterium]|jgi:hypothetical protein|nr:hypothetical protein [Vicinamibacterales bacterium]